MLLHTSVQPMLAHDGKVPAKIEFELNGDMAEQFNEMMQEDDDDMFFDEESY